MHRTFPFCHSVPGPNCFADRLLRIGLFFCAIAVCAFGADEAKRTYNIPAGDAVAALKAFSVQSGQSALFSEDQVKGVRTKAVAGELTSSEALASLLAGTPLYAVPKGSGAYAIKREETADPNGARAARERDRPAVQSMANAEQTKDEVVHLSPFQVNTSFEKGYAGTTAVQLRGWGILISSWLIIGNLFR